MQSRWMSLIEAVTNIVVGYGLAVLTGNGGGKLDHGSGGIGPLRAA